MVSFLPDLLDTGAAGRNTLIEQLQKLADANKRKPFGWVWTVAGAQPELEKALNVGGAGFPALSAINGKKLKYATHRRAFESKPIQEFVNSLVAGREATAPLSNEKLPTIAKVNAWDGQDAELSYEEEIDLSELDDVEVELKKEEL